MRPRALLASTILLLLGAAGMAAGSGEGSRTRRLVLCLDGTLNSPEQDVESRNGYHLYKPTNVLKTYRAIRPLDDDGVSQIAYYSEGVGSFIGEPSFLGRLAQRVDRVSGGISGIGYAGGVKSAYRFLVANYQPGDRDQPADQVLVFGFSRGAAQARTLVRFTDWVGGVLHKDDEYYIPELWDAYRTSQAAAGRARSLLDEIRRRRRDPKAIKDPQPV